MNDALERLLSFKKRYPKTIAWRLRKHMKVIETHIDPDETIKYIFCGQRGRGNFFSTKVVAITNRRIFVASKRMVWGYFLDIITRDMFNDFNIKGHLIWGDFVIDTIKEEVVISKIDKAALNEIEDELSREMELN